jgi:class 3 adenylate cyclase
VGFVLSWAFILPVRHIGRALDGLAAGDFAQRVIVPNRDEFGMLTRNLNSMSHRLAVLYDELRTLNGSLQEKVAAQVEEIERVSTLKRFLSPQVVESLVSGAGGVELSSRRRELTIFFSDIRGFTAMSERIEPEELVDLLNHYLTAMTEIVFKHGGTLDKYIGDAIMVFFGDPIPHQDHAARAVRMALEMRSRLQELQKEWLLRTDEDLNIGMGISTGYVTVGSMGGADRLEYTVLGNHVNLASRLADMAEPNQILIAERTFRAVHDLVDAHEIQQITIEGVSRPVHIYEINELV